MDLSASEGYFRRVYIVEITKMVPRSKRQQKETNVPPMRQAWGGGWGRQWGRHLKFSFPDRWLPFFIWSNIVLNLPLNNLPTRQDLLNKTPTWPILPQTNYIYIYIKLLEKQSQKKFVVRILINTNSVHLYHSKYAVMINNCNIGR